MATARMTPKKPNTPEWLRCQDTIRKLLKHLGKDSLVYAKEVLEYEDNESDKLKTFWEYARRAFDEYETPKPIFNPASEIVNVPESKNGSA